MVLCFFFFLDCSGCSLLCRLFSTCGEQGLFSSCSVQTSYCGGFSHCGAQALSMRASAVASHGLSGEVPRGSRAHLVALRHVGSSGTRNQTCVSCMSGRFFTTEPPWKPL